MVIQVKNKDYIMNMNKVYILFVLALFCAQGWAKPFEADGIWYETTSTNTVRVVEEPVASGEGTSFSFRKCYEGDITIPETVTSGGNTYSVVAVKDGTFRESAKLTSVTIPATLTDLGNAPFADCPRLASIAVAEDNPSFAIVDGLLCDKAVAMLIACPGTAEGDVAVPSTITTLATSAFHGCANITSITLPEGVTSIGKHAFQGCAQLITVNLPEGITTISDSTFYYCSALTDITIPTTVTSIGVKAFYHCNKLARQLEDHWFPRFRELQQGKENHHPRTGDGNCYVGVLWMQQPDGLHRGRRELVVLQPQWGALRQGRADAAVLPQCEVGRLRHALFRQHHR